MNGCRAILSIALVGGLTAVAGCADRSDRDGPGPAAEAAAIENEVLAADSAFARETAEGGAAAWAAWFEAEGSMVRGTGEIVGRASIREAMTPFLSDTTVRFTWKPGRAIAEPGSDLAATIGSYRITAADSAATVLERGMYLSVWRRQDDGSWKVAADIGAPAPSE